MIHQNCAMDSCSIGTELESQVKVSLPLFPTTIDQYLASIMQPFHPEYQEIRPGFHFVPVESLSRSESPSATSSVSTVSQGSVNNKRWEAIEVMFLISAYSRSPLPSEE